jgi:hypothetical protein
MQVIGDNQIDIIYVKIKEIFPQNKYFFILHMNLTYSVDYLLLQRAYMDSGRSQATSFKLQVERSEAGLQVGSRLQIIAPHRYLIFK